MVGSMYPSIEGGRSKSTPVEADCGPWPSFLSASPSSLCKAEEEEDSRLSPAPPSLFLDVLFIKTDKIVKLQFLSNYVFSL